MTWTVWIFVHSSVDRSASSFIMCLCDREKEVSSSLRLQVEEVQRREEEVKRENDRLRRERDRQEEKSRQLETESHRRY